jgi:Protein of unknown function (DUF2795)
MVDNDKKLEGHRISGQKSSEGGRGDPNKASPAAIERYMKGIHFPAHKEDLLNQARDNGAPQDVLNVLDRFSEHEYHSPIDIAKEVKQAE